MAGFTEEFVLTDRWGDGHSYIVTLHPASEGQRVMMALLAAASGTLGDLIGRLATMPDVLAAVRAHMGGDNDGPDMPLDEVLGRVSWAEVGRDLREVLAAPETAELLPAIMAHTVRDGQALSARMNYDVAYRGNYQELLAAAARVVRANGFFPLPGIS